MRETFGTLSTLRIVFRCSDIASGLHVVPFVDVAMFKDLCYKINEKSNDNVNSTFNSIH